MSAHSVEQSLWHEASMVNLNSLPREVDTQPVALGAAVLGYLDSMALEIAAWTSSPNPLERVGVTAA